MTSPEQFSRKKIDQMFVQAGWQVQDLKDINPDAATTFKVLIFQFSN